MLPKSEMQSIAQKLDLELFNQVTDFILETAKASLDQLYELNRHCFLRTSEPITDTMQEKYGFLYLGELLERYEERFGMPDEDLRAIALALGFTSELLTANMFVGNQKYVFLDKVRAKAEDDLFLAGALCLLGDDAPKWENLFHSREYSSTEELIFIISLCPDFSQFFDLFKPHLLRLLGKERSLPVLGNTKLLDWLIVRIIPILKGYRGKDAALFRALCALPRMLVKPGSREFDELTANGYTSLEIAYANMMCVQSQTADRVLRTDSVVTKIAVQLFQEVVSQKEPCTPGIYDWLSDIYYQYARFPKLCYGTHSLIHAIEERAMLQNADTFIWLADMAGLNHDIFACFDIMDTKWDKLAEVFEHEKYRRLFRDHLSNDMSKEEIQSRIARYNALTGASYVSECLETDGYGMKLLVEKGIIDLWNSFCGCLDQDGEAANQNVMKNITDYLCGGFNLSVFRFCEKYFAGHDMYSLEQLLGYNRNSLFRNLYSIDGYYSDKLTLCNSFLDEEMQRTLLGWLQDYIFAYEPEKYLKFALLVLTDKEAAHLLSPSEQRTLFDQLIGQKDLVGHRAEYLKQRYLTPDELAAEHEAEAAAKLEMERQAQAVRESEIRARFQDMEHTFPKILKFLDRNIYSLQYEQIACTVVREQLDALLSAAGYCLDRGGMGSFLKVCGKLVENDALKISEIQDYIKLLKEDKTNDNNCDTAC